MQPQSTIMSAAQRRNYILERYSREDEDAIAQVLGMKPRSVRCAASRLGLLTPPRSWSDDEIALLCEVYTKHEGKSLSLDLLANQLGRTKSTVSAKARQLGLTRRGRPIPEAGRVAIGKQASARLKANGHPRGALGLKHTEDTKQRMSDGSKRVWQDPASGHHTEARRQRRVEIGIERVKSGVLPMGEKAYSRGSPGRASDLGDQYFRSSWERNYARFLNLMIAQGAVSSWEYEKHTFWFEAIRRGVRSYTPDFRVLFPDGHHEWHEVKGWMDPKSKTKLKRMTKYHPREVVTVVGQEWFRQAMRSGLAGVVPHWERKAKRAVVTLEHMQPAAGGEG